jgi:plasmid maintenance system antidote protein VapI
MKTQKIHKEISENDIWNKSKVQKLRDHILTESKKQSHERRLRNELLSIQYKIEDYIENENIAVEMKILDFVKLYLKSLNLTKKKLASAFEMGDSNLHKYLKGERKLNPDIVFKLSSFSHTKPELWYFIQAKNELLKLKSEKNKLKQYEKYDYEKILAD